MTISLKERRWDGAALPNSSILWSIPPEIPQGSEKMIRGPEVLIFDSQSLFFRSQSFLVRWPYVVAHSKEQIERFKNTVFKRWYVWARLDDFGKTALGLSSAFLQRTLFNYFCVHWHEFLRFLAEYMHFLVFMWLRSFDLKGKTFPHSSHLWLPLNGSPGPKCSNITLPNFRRKKN